MKIFQTQQIRQIDSLTIEKEPITSINLMERAARSIFNHLICSCNKSKSILIVSGPGNNGGDGLALGRILASEGYDANVVLINNGKLSSDCAENRKRFTERYSKHIVEYSDSFSAPIISENTIIIDAIFGSGLTRKTEGIYTEVINWINQSECPVFAIDIPSGLPGEGLAFPDSSVVKADITYTLQFPKLSFFIPENRQYTGNWEIVDIGLHPEAIQETESRWLYTDIKEVGKIVKRRPAFSHKGTFGHTCIWAGKEGMAGAAVLASKGALRAGTGLLSIYSKPENRSILQTAVPEAIFRNEPISENRYSAIAAGPGIGQDKKTTQQLETLLNQLSSPCVLDADALNIIAANKELLALIPPGSILSPHPKEFERLTNKCANSFERINLASTFAVKYSITLILKGANTLIATPDGRIRFNSSGNPGMATGGMGDVLTGILASLLSQGYSSEESAIVGVYLHGLAADLALENQSYESLLPSDVIEYLGKAFNLIHKNK